MQNDGAGPFDYLTPEEKELIFRFLALVRDNYKKAEKAGHFLEQRAGISHTCSIANLRDVLSHLSTLLDGKTPSEKRRDQLADAEEHLRRAIIEPYEIALGDLVVKFNPAYEVYRRLVIPKLQSGITGFRAALSRVAIEGVLTEIEALTEQGKHAKGRNRWDDEWESGVSGLIDGYNKLSSLLGDVESWNFRVEEYARGGHHTRLHKWAIAWAIAGILVGAVGSYVITKYVTPAAAQPVQDPPPVQQK